MTDNEAARLLESNGNLYAFQHNPEIGKAILMGAEALKEREWLTEQLNAQYRRNNELELRLDIERRKNGTTN